MLALAVTRFGAANRRGSAALLAGLVLRSRWSAGFGVARLRRGISGKSGCGRWTPRLPFAENPTSSSTMYTTLSAPSGAFAGSNGAQSGTESRMSTFDHALKQLTHRNRLACRAAHQIPRTWRASHPARNQTSHLTGERLCRARPAALKVVIKSAYMESPGSSGGQLSSTGALARAASSERVILRWLTAGRTRLPVVLGARNPGSRVWGVTAGASSPGRRPEPSPAERGHPRP